MSVQKVLGPGWPPLGFYTKPGPLDERPRRAERELRARAEVDDAAPEERVGHVRIARVEQQFDRRRASRLEGQFLLPTRRGRPPPARRLACLLAVRRPHEGVCRADGLEAIAAPEEPPRAVHLDDELVPALDRRARDFEPGLRRSSASRGVPAVSRHRRDSSPRMMAVGGFFVDFGPIRTASGSSRGATGEVPRTAPERGHRRADAAAGRPSTRRRRSGGPGEVLVTRRESWSFS